MTSQIPPSSTNSQDFEKIALIYLEDLYRFAFSLCHEKAQAEDIVQESVMKAYRSFGSFEQGSNVKAWLFRIVRNTFISQYRKNKRIVSLADQDDVEAKDFSFYRATKAEVEKESRLVPKDGRWTPEYFEQVFGDEIKEALAALSEQYREIIFLCDVQEMSYQEIAEILEIPIGTVRSRLSRARSTLQRLLWQYAHDRGLWRKPS